MHRKSTPKEKRKGLRKAKSYLKKYLTKKEKAILKKVEAKAKKGQDTKERYSEGGMYLAKRRKMHNRIIKKYETKDTPTKDPDLYIMAGVPGSGKSTVARKYIKERTVVINNDDIKAEIARRNKSPIKSKPLIHGTLLHAEAKDIEEDIIVKVRRQRKDVTLDRTGKNYRKNLREIEKFRRAGYDIHVVGTNLKPHISVQRAAKRFVSDGRYVPLENVTRYGNSTNQNVFRYCKKPYVESCAIMDTQGRPGNEKIIYRKIAYKKRQLNDKRRIARRWLANL